MLYMGPARRQEIGSRSGGSKDRSDDLCACQPWADPTGVVHVLNEKARLRRNGTPWTQRQVASVIARGDFYHDGATRYGAVPGVSERLVFLSRSSRQ
jgi:hypothetical protein